MGDAREIRQAARDAYQRRDWAGARAGFVAAREQAALPAADAFLLSDAAWWLGGLDESLAAAEEAYDGHLREGHRPQAAMAALVMAVYLSLRGSDVVASGWIGRAQRLLEGEPECVEHGYLCYVLEVEGGLDGGDPDGVVAAGRRVQELGRRFDDPNLVAMGAVGEGRALARLGRLAEGLTLLDEAMVAVCAGELDPEWAGNAYCHVMAACYEVGEIRRAVAWTEETTRWLETLPAAVVFAGICRVHRAQALQIAGAWERAEHEAARVCEELRDLHVPSVAEGQYQVGELRRLRGDLRAAARAYEQAHRHGRDPQPGIALLRLAEGRLDAASASIQSALAAETADRPARFRLRAAQVEIALASGALDVAREACAELDAIAADYGSCGFETTALQARGALLLAAGEAGEALRPLRQACRRWQELDAAHDTARTRMLLADAYLRLGDTDAADRELDAAEPVLARLGAAPDAGRAASLRSRRALPGGLTEREAEVLACVATGGSNREVAGALVISEKTVARHLSNIFVKLGVSSRTEAAAYAFEHGIAPRPRG